jgi:hypothetical protein
MSTYTTSSFVRWVNDVPLLSRSEGAEAGIPQLDDEGLTLEGLQQQSLGLEHSSPVSEALKHLPGMSKALTLIPSPQKRMFSSLTCCPQSLCVFVCVICVFIKDTVIRKGPTALYPLCQ